MNDDFLRRARRPPPPAFANQLRERLRRQELAESSRRRPGWRLWTIPLLIGGTVLASGTYLAMKHGPSFPSPSTEVTQTAPAPAAASRPSNAGPDAAYRATRTGTAFDQGTWSHAPSSPSENPGNPTSGSRDDERASTEAFGGAVARRDEAGSSMRSGTSPVPPLHIVVDHEVAAIMDKTSLPATRLSGNVEITTADTAFRALCDTAPAHRPDVVFTSRPIRAQEALRCNQHRVGGLLGAKLGHVAVVISGADHDHPLRLSADILLRALLKKIPSPEDPSRFIANPYTHWRQIDPLLPDRRIEVLGPKRDSLAFLVLAIAVLEPACDGYASMRDLKSTDRKAYEDICHSPREDGAYTQAALDGTFVQQRFWSAPGAIAVVDFPFYSENRNDLFGSLLKGAAPTRESIVDGSYAGARTMHLYVSRARYERAGTVRHFVDSHVRQQYHFGYHNVLIPPDGATDRWPPRPAELIDVPLEGTKGNNR